MKYVITSNDGYYIATMGNRISEKLLELEPDLKDDEVIVVTIEKVKII